MDGKKIFILLPDGVGLRNFAFTEFCNLGKEQGLEMVFWNNTAFKLSELGLKEVAIKDAKIHPLTEIFKNARKQVELNLNIIRSGDKVYNTYRFPYSYKNIKTTVKTLAVRAITYLNSTDSGLIKIRHRIKRLERQTSYYQRCLEALKAEKPDVVFCTNQRHTSAIAPILAAQDLGIPTASFIFSWDNLPKAMMVIETDFYFVWSDHMKSELRYYYPNIIENQIFVTGTPQFEPHFNPSLIVSKSDFFNAHQLDITRKYICFSGDDFTTSPNDPIYLSDVADSVRKLNDNGHRLGIIFRRCPVDFSPRYDEVLRKNADLITPIVPRWEKMGESWNAVLPTKSDLMLQINTIFHTEMVINLGSSMVFDYAAFGKPCAFINYNIANNTFPDWSVQMIYNYIHFRSMPDQNAVIWLNNATEIAEKVKNSLAGNAGVVGAAQRWLEKINQHPAELASQRILDGLRATILK